MAKKKGKAGLKKGKTGFRPNHTAGVSGDEKDRIARLLEDFRNSQDKIAYTFETNMSKQERAMVHLLCRKMNMTSKSTGKGEQRYVTVYKNDKKCGGKVKTKALPYEGTSISSFAFSEESKRVLMDLFMHHPPGKDKIGEQKLPHQSTNTSQSRGIMDDTFLRPVMSKAEIARKVESLTHKVQSVPRLAEIFRKRSKLPIASFRDAITSAIANNQVVLICGETGCGKTTQVPQYLLDDMWAKGEACKIICTQPRRISAISVSERIAQERGETIGNSVGYKIRLESRAGRQSSILFCTGGVLLRLLISSRESESGEPRVKAEKHISEITHIVVDEIHERDRYSDFMLTILRDLLPARPHLRLVLMSATIDAERFSEYFGGCPVVRVPGFTHPVKSFYLEDILSMLKTPERNHLDATPTLLTSRSHELNLSEEYQIVLDEAIELSLNEEFDSLLDLISSQGKPAVLNYRHSSTGVTPLMVFAGKGKVSDVCTLLSLGADCYIQDRDGTTALDWAKRGDHTEVVEIIKKHIEAASSGSIEEQQLVQQYVRDANPDVIDYVLIEKLLKKICTESKDGAILVFLPGWEDISRTQKTLLAISFFKNPSKFLVLPLHSMVPSADQKKVFAPPPRGCRKIILSTNVAETSVTIDDVVYVIDSGRLKEQNYDPFNNVSTLQSSWISKASAKQREGRAGRCQPGLCFHLYSKLKAVSLADFQVPEIKRMPIEELCLQVKMLDPNCKVVDFLNRTLDPPILETINNAIAVLQDVGALSADEELTDLGKKLSSLPVHPLMSKMLFSGILLNCLDPALTLACAADYRDPFTLPMLPNDKLKADMARAKLSSLYGGLSDQLATVAAFECWERAKARGKELWFCSQYYLSRNIMSMLSGMRKQLLNELKRCGFVPSDASECSLNSRDPGIVRAVVVAGLYPRIGKLVLPHKVGRPSSVETSSGMRPRLLSRSILSKYSSDELCDEHGQSALVLYDAVTRGDAGLQVRSCTVISPLPLLLLAKEIAVVSGNDETGNDAIAEEDGKSDSPADGDMKDSDIAQTESLKDTSKEGMNSPDNSVVVVVDGWVSFKLTALEVAQIYCLRERLSAAILFRISNPKKAIPPPLMASIYAVVSLMSYDGLTGINLHMTPPADVDIFTALLNTPDISKKGNTTSSNLLTCIPAHRSSGKSSSNARTKYVVHPLSSREILPPVTALPPPQEMWQPLLVVPHPTETPISGQPLLVGPQSCERPVSGPPVSVCPQPQETPISRRPLPVSPAPPRLTVMKRKVKKKPKKTCGVAVKIPPAPPQPTLVESEVKNEPENTGGVAKEIPPASPQPTLVKNEVKNEPEKTGGVAEKIPPAPPQPTLVKSEVRNEPEKTGGVAEEIQPSPPQPTLVKRKVKVKPKKTGGVAKEIPPASPRPTLTNRDVKNEPEKTCGVDDGISPLPPQPTLVKRKVKVQPKKICGVAKEIPPVPPQPNLVKSEVKNEPEKTCGVAEEIPPVPPQPTLVKREVKNKPEKTCGLAKEISHTTVVVQQPNEGTVGKEPCVQPNAVALKKRKRKSKAETHVTWPDVAPQASSAPYSGLGALVSMVGSNPFGPYGPRGR